MPVDRLDRLIFSTFFPGKEAIEMARKLRQISLGVSLAALALFTTGCVTSADKYDALKMRNSQLETQLGDAEAKARASQAQADAYKNQLAALLDGSNSQGALAENLSKQNALLAAENADLKRRYEDALKNVGATALPVAVSNALSDFARANPELVDFDSARGIVKFKSDLTFALGSAEVTENARKAIGRFAQILNSDAARGYELMVAGHTDTTPVANPATKAKHPDNWYLSAHRAISVATALMTSQVGQQRIGVTGYGDQRPIASNGSAEGKAQNRRVEVMILPSTVRSGSTVAGAPRNNGARTAGAAQPGGLNKDTTVVAPETKPVFNK
jgi:chemotaxis protein MotB